MRSRRRARGVLRSSALSLAASLAAPFASLAARLLAHPVLPHAIASPRRIFASVAAGRVSYYEDDAASGPPLVMLHGLGPLGCAYELRGLFEALRSERPVLAVDMPGYAFSERRARIVPREQTVAFLEELLVDVSRRYGAAVDVVAGERTAAIVASAVARTTRSVRSLVVLAPGRADVVPSLARGALVDLRSRALASPLVGASVHYVLTTRTALRRALARRRVRRDEGLVRYANTVARQPRARFATLARLSGALSDDFRSDAEILGALRIPVLVVHGEGAAVSSRPGAVTSWRDVREAHVAGAGGMPHVERPFETAEALRAFHRSLAVKPQLRLIRGDRPEGAAAWVRRAPGRGVRGTARGARRSGR